MKKYSIFVIVALSLLMVMCEELDSLDENLETELQDSLKNENDTSEAVIPDSSELEIDSFRLVSADLELAGVENLKATYQASIEWGNYSPDTSDLIFVQAIIWYGDGYSCTSIGSRVLKVPPGQGIGFDPSFKHYYDSAGIYTVEIEAVVFFVEIYQDTLLALVEGKEPLVTNFGNDFDIGVNEGQSLDTKSIPVPTGIGMEYIRLDEYIIEKSGIEFPVNLNKLN